jgi:hypothetical protein
MFFKNYIFIEFYMLQNFNSKSCNIILNKKSVRDALLIGLRNLHLRKFTADLLADNFMAEHNF